MTLAATTITIPVDKETAQRYLTSSPIEKESLDILLQLHLRELIELPPENLLELMDEIGAKAQARGLTPEILAELLRDE